MHTCLCEHIRAVGSHIVAGTGFFVVMSTLLLLQGRMPRSQALRPGLLPDLPPLLQMPWASLVYFHSLATEVFGDNNQNERHSSPAFQVVPSAKQEPSVFTVERELFSGGSPTPSQVNLGLTPGASTMGFSQ